MTKKESSPRPTGRHKPYPPPAPPPPPGRAKPKRDYAEEAEIKVWLDWCTLVQYQGEPLIERVVMVPNQRGTSGPQIAVYVGLGLRSGFPDYAVLIYVPGPDGAGGLYLEAKRKGEKARAKQVQWIEKLRRWGYEAEACDSGLDLIIATQRYMAAHARPGHFVDRTRIGLNA